NLVEVRDCSFRALGLEHIAGSHDSGDTGGRGVIGDLGITIDDVEVAAEHFDLAQGAVHWAAARTSRTSAEATGHSAGPHAAHAHAGPTWRASHSRSAAFATAARAASPGARAVSAFRGRTSARPATRLRRRLRVGECSAKHEACEDFRKRF